MWRRRSDVSLVLGGGASGGASGEGPAPTNEKTEVTVGATVAESRGVDRVA